MNANKTEITKVTPAPKTVYLGTPRFPDRTTIILTTDNHLITPLRGLF